MTPEDKSQIEELKKTLYSRNAPDIRVKRRLRFRRTEQGDVPTDWQHPDEAEAEEVTLNKRYEDHSMSFFTKLLIASCIFFILAVGAGAYLIMNGSNIISANNIEVAVNGPVTVAGGDPVSFDIQINNKNNIKLSGVELQVDFPAGTVEADDRSKELKSYTKAMKDIVPGGVGQDTVRAVIYGEENTKKEITVNVSYKVAGSNAIFKKQKTYEILISSSPLSLSVSSFKEVTSGQEFTFEASLSSNSEEIIKNLLLKVSFPFGFTFISSDLKSEDGGTLWRVGDIPPRGKKVIRFKGKLEGQNEETRVFRFTAGSQSLRDSGAIGTEYVSVSQDVSIKKPFMTADIAIEGDQSKAEYISDFNVPVTVQVSWFNNLETAVIDGEIHVKLFGNAFDKASVAPADGNYRSADNEIVWNKVTNPNLSNIGPGESGRVTFTVTPRDLSVPFKLVTNPNLLIGVAIQGKRLSESNVPETLAASAERRVIVPTSLTLSSAIVRSTGPFENVGPMPPKSERQTTYTVVWTADNTSSTVSGAEVHSALPAYVKWTGKVSPGEDVSFNSNNNQIVWRVGNVDTYTVTSGHRRQVSFQIAFEPNVTQIGQIPILIQDMTMTGHDDYTEKTLTGTNQGLNTNFNSDPAFREGDAVVTP